MRTKTERGDLDMTDLLHNPKLDEQPGSNTEKDPENWVSGDNPMTGAHRIWPL